MYQGSFDYALQIFTNIIHKDPSWSEAWNKRATLLFLMNDFSQSLKDIDQVLKLEPRHFGALSGRAQIYIKQERFDGGNETSLYQPGVGKPPKHKSPKHKKTVDHEEVNILMDTSIQRVMKKNRELQKQLKQSGSPIYPF